jgi:hypothetical protein
MAAVVASVGGILVVLSFSGVSLESRVVTTRGPVPPGDRVAAALIGWALIAIGMLVEVRDLSEPTLWVGLGIGTLSIVGYATFLVQTRPRSETPVATPSGSNE